MHQSAQHAHLDGGEVGDPLAQHGVLASFPCLTQVQRLEAIRRLGREIALPDQALDRREKRGVVGHHDLRVEDAGFFRAGAVAGAFPEHGELAGDFVGCGVEADDLAVHLGILDRAVGNFRKRPPEPQRGRECDSG